MNDYSTVRGWAPMIREVVRTKRMPPWHADPHIGVWKDDKSLSTEQTKTLVHWIEAGAPRGSGPDPLADTKVIPLDWPWDNPTSYLSFLSTLSHRQVSSIINIQVCQTQWMQEFGSRPLLWCLVIARSFTIFSLGL